MNRPLGLTVNGLNEQSISITRDMDEIIITVELSKGNVYNLQFEAVAAEVLGTALARLAKQAQKR